MWPIQKEIAIVQKNAKISESIFSHFAPIQIKIMLMI